MGVAMTFTIGVQDDGSATTVSLAGELDMATAPGLTRRIADLLAAGRSRIVLDLDALAFCDSAGLNAFVQGDKQCAAAGGWLRLNRARGHVARVLELSGVDEVLAYRADS
jgi:anti-anti-sigma factor